MVNMWPSSFSRRNFNERDNWVRTVLILICKCSATSLYFFPSAYTIIKIMAAEIAGENVTKEEREKMNRWWEEKRGNERTYKMLMGELGEVVRLVRQQGGLDREKAYERLESDIRKKMTVRKGKIRRMRWWSFGASVAGVLLILGVGIMLWMKPEENGVWEGKIRRMRWWSFGASVAGVLLILGVGIMLWMKPEENGVWEGEKTVEPGIGQVVLTLGDGESVPLKRDTNRLIFGGTMLQVRNERGTLVYSKIKSKEASEKIVYNTLTVPVRERFQLVLADGTKVFLNSGSEMRYPERFGKARREVFLKGEAWFEVAKDSAREFWVHAGAMDVKVLGTSFNVKAYERLETVATTLVEGSVEVACAGKSFQIVPGEQFVYDKNNRVMDVRMVDTESYVSWKDGYYKFRQTTLEEIMETLSVWYGLNVFYVNESAKQVEFTGKVRRYEDARMLLDKFEQTGDVVFDIKGNNVFITIKQKKPFAREWNSFLVKARGMVWQS